MSIDIFTDMELTQRQRRELGLVDLNLFGKPGLLCDQHGTLVRPTEDPNYARIIVNMGFAAPADVFYRDPYYEDA